MRYLQLGCLLILASFLTACTSSRMKVKPKTDVTSPSEGQAKVVFMRDSFLGSAIQASLFETTSGDPEFIGILSNGTKIPYEVEPGKHVFMVISESADFMRAHVKEGKTYYAMVTPRMGAWKARFSFKPIRKDGEGEYTLGSSSFKSWVSGTEIAKNTPDSRKWAEQHMDDIVNKYESYWPEWQEKSKEEKKKQTLFAKDGK